MKVAIVHDWLNGMRGGEKVLEVLCELFPNATLFTLLFQKGKLSDKIERMDIRTSFVQKLPFVFKNYRYYFPLFPKAIERFDFSGYDLIISSSHCIAKSVIKPDNALHLCYCHTPMRYAYDKYHDYFPKGKVNPIKNLIISKIIKKIRKWDQKTANRVGYYAANSENIANKIKKYYGIEADVIHPPIDTEFFTPTDEMEDFFLAVSPMVHYKRAEIAIEAFKKDKKNLTIVGIGPLLKKLKTLANGYTNITFEGWVTQERLRELYRKCKALIFPADEDFGITPLEAQACGRPVIAFKKGGALETVIDGKTGIFFLEQTADSLIQAITIFENLSFNKDAIRNNALRFDTKIFKEKISNWINNKTETYFGKEKTILPLETKKEKIIISQH